MLRSGERELAKKSFCTGKKTYENFWCYKTISFDDT